MKVIKKNTNFKFHLMSQGKCKKMKMDRQQQKDRKANGDEGKRDEEIIWANGLKAPQSQIFGYKTGTICTEQEFYLDLRKNHQTADSTPITTRQLESLIRLTEVS